MHRYSAQARVRVRVRVRLGLELMDWKCLSTPSERAHFKLLHASFFFEIGPS